MTKRHKLGDDPKLPKVAAFIRRMEGGGDEFDRLIAAIRKRDGPFLHAAKPKVVDVEEDEDVVDDVEEVDEGEDEE